MSKKLSASKRARMIMLLQRARIRIKGQENSHVCFALQDVVTYMLPFGDDKRVRQSWAASDYLCDWVHSMLGTYHTLQDWLIKRYGYSNVVHDTQKLRQTRLKWIDWMINELKEGR
jgi:hypothetical protein